jgi:flagella basal body P-ring formation protein FlgA
MPNREMPNSEMPNSEASSPIGAPCPARVMAAALLLASALYAHALCASGGWATENSSRSEEAIVLRERADVVANIVRLGDLADVVVHDAERRRALEELELMVAPRMGESKLVRVRQLQEWLMLRDVDLLRVPLRGASRTEVVRRSPEHSVGSGPEAQRPREPESSHDQLVVLSRKMRRGDIVTSHDMKLAKVDSGLPPESEWLLDIEDAVGMQLNRSLAAGEPLDRRWLEAPLLVRRGEFVSVVVRSGGIEVRTTGRAMGEGTQNSVVVVESIDGRRSRWTGRVTSVDTVEILAPSSPVAARRPRSSSDSAGSQAAEARAVSPLAPTSRTARDSQGQESR